MRLEVHQPPDCPVRIIAVDPDLRLIALTVLELDWSDISFVELCLDDNHSLGVSGSFRYGFAATCRENGIEKVSDRPLDSLEEMVALLQSYRAGDDQWWQMIGWG